MTNAEKLALVVFAEWHSDEVTDMYEATQYARRLLARLREEGLVIVESQENN